jgi:hypothetical protein
MLHPADLRLFMRSVLKSRFRKRGYVDRFVGWLEQYGTAEVTWSFVPRIMSRDDHWVTVHAWVDAEGYHLQCTGPQAEAAVERANTRDRASQGRSKRISKRLSMRDRRERRYRKSEARRADMLAARGPKSRKVRKKVHVPAPISYVRNEALTPQFRKNRVTWSETLTAVVAIFEVRGNGKYSARQLVAREMWDSLERSGFRFAQYKRRGFVFRVDLIDGVWRGEITPLRVSCTKDTKHATYRRTREYIAGLVLGLPEKECRVRRQMLMCAAERAAA